MDLQLVDVTLHIDEELSPERRQDVEQALRSTNGVVSVHNPEDRSHLTVVEYNPQQTNSQDLLRQVRAFGIHAELIGL